MSILFLKSSDGLVNLADDERLSLFARCLREQQMAGFGETIDARQFHCPVCKSPGFNTGWGHIDFVCGGEQVDEYMWGPCGKQGTTVA